MSLLAKGFLLFSDAIIISPLLIIGFATRGGFFIKSPSKEGVVIWGNASFLVLFTMIFNVFLKSLFLIPLDPGLGIKGFAFPSGHMQVAFVLYGWLFLSYSHRILRGILIFILMGIGYGLIQQGYHNHADVFGAATFGVAVLYVFHKSATTLSIRANPSRLGLYLIPLAGILGIGIYFRIGLPPHIVKTYLGLIGFSLLWWTVEQIYRQKKKYDGSILNEPKNYP